MLCLAQVATVNALGLNPPERIWWASISGNALLLSKTVADFLELDSRDDRTDLLYEASAHGDGTYSSTPGQAKVLAATLLVRLRRGSCRGVAWSPGDHPACAFSPVRALTCGIPLPLPLVILE